MTLAGGFLFTSCTPPSEGESAETLTQEASPGAPREWGAGPNIIMIAVDTLRADHLTFIGHDRATSTHIDRLANDSLAFHRAIAAAPWTTPSFAGIFTGRHPGSLGITAEATALPEEIPTLAERLEAGGYLTAGVVSHLFVGRKFGFDRGFDPWDESNAGGHTTISSSNVTDLAIDRLRELSREEQPFFLFAHYFDPHYDYRGHDEFPFHEGYSGDLRSGHDNFERLRRDARNGNLGPDDLQYLKDLYDSEIAYADSQIGRLLDELRRMGAYEDAIIVFVADHGEMFGERQGGWLGHTRYLFDELVHVPLLIKLPQSSRKGRLHHEVSLVDIYPTILDLAEIEASPRSLVHPEKPKSPVFSQTRRWHQLDAVYDRGWKLIMNRKTGESALFNLKVDPGETVSLAKEHPRRLRQMSAMLDQWSGELQDAATQLAPIEQPTLSPEEEQRLRSLGYVQ